MEIKESMKWSHFHGREGGCVEEWEGMNEWLKKQMKKTDSWKEALDGWKDQEATKVGSK